MKKIGTVILAAGMGRRLGLGVKALVPVGGKPLIDHLLQKSGEDVIVYTSRATHDPIQAYVKDRALFLQEMGGEEFPLGNGTLYSSLCASPLMASKWSEISVTIRTRSNDVMMREKRI